MNKQEEEETEEEEVAFPNPKILTTEQLREWGVPGFREETLAVFRRAFITRTFPAEVVQQLGLQQTKGLVLYGRYYGDSTGLVQGLARMLHITVTDREYLYWPHFETLPVGSDEFKGRVDRCFAAAEADPEGLHFVTILQFDTLVKLHNYRPVIERVLEWMARLDNVLVFIQAKDPACVPDEIMGAGKFECKIHVESDRTRMAREPQFSLSLEDMEILSGAHYLHDTLLKYIDVIRENSDIEDAAERRKRIDRVLHEMQFSLDQRIELFPKLLLPAIDRRLKDEDNPPDEEVKKRCECMKYQLGIPPVVNLH